MIRVERLEKRHPGEARPVLRELSFSVESGALAAVVGASGAGKSTLLRCLGGLDGFDGGSISVGDTTVGAGRSATEALRGRVGLVFQSLDLFPHLTVLGNCALAPRRVLGLSAPAAAERARHHLERLGVAEHAQRFPDYLSGGQRQRVAIARALAMEPRVLLYDEPTSALDATLRREVLSTLRQVQESGVTQIVVTHDLALAREAARPLFVLDDGGIADEARAAALLAAWSGG